ncbi:N-formylglutamate deformylase [Celeribacter ethanolicus]|uniref:N-formylglutamate deformylase n=1 Tax=Celeribacter ethanolicus TaxID=1758178 RepID=A0A291GA87_9RHOB|nr:N-formylglutamate deformylase [Celeribacter ethanolicus]ATG46974.1 N-formylglutamate deformylase [Celeribacter ethanolicus]TNE69316.1 MAG: N-formylglutamate deformylase [Paracoccaceae bacterium]
MQDAPALPEKRLVFEQICGSTPLLLNVPHAGTQVPDSLRAALTPGALDLSDTDWHMDRIARDLLPEGASLMVANVTRYAVDLNRPSDDKPLYAGATTGLMSTITFDGVPLYRPGAEPDAAEQAERIAAWWTPYHAALAAEIARIKAAHGYCVMLDMHSIRSQVPRLFEGRLPDLNLGTNSGAACAPGLSDAAFAALQASEYSAVRDGRFKGGYITRHYGQPEQNVHALQIEIAQECYMQEETPWSYIPERADRLKETLARLIAVMADFHPETEQS